MICRDEPVPPRQFGDDAPTDQDAPRLAGTAREGADLSELTGILIRRRNSLLAGMAVATGLALAYLATAPTVFTATTSILIDARTRAPLGGDSSALNANPPDAVLIESQVRVIASDAVLARVVQRENLVEDGDYANTRPGLLSQALQIFGLAGAKAPAADNAARALAVLARSVVVKRSERTYVIDVEVGARDAQKAARLADAVAAAYIGDRQATKADAARRDAAVLNARLADLQKQLSEAETKVQVYKQSHQIYDANGKRVNEQDLTEGATALSLARSRTAEAKARHEQIQRIVASGRPADAVSESLKSPLVDRLRGQYADGVRQEATLRTTLGDRHPALIETQNQLRQIKGLIAEELKRVAAGAANEYQTARSTEAAAERQVGALKKGTDVTSFAAVELRDLEHDLEARKVTYDRFLRARDTIGEDGPDGQFARVIAPAIAPAAPSAPKTLVILALALASGLFGGITQAFVAEYLANSAPLPERRSTVAQPVEVERRRRGWPGIWPFAKKYARLAHAAPPFAAQETPAPAVQRQAVAIDPDIFASLIDDAFPAGFGAARARRPFTVLVTSLDEGAGKTTASLALARAASERGARVLVIEADNNHPVLSGFVQDGPPDLIDLMGMLRLCHRLAADPDVRVVPISDGEEMVVRRLSRRATVETIDGIAGNFDIVVLDGDAIGPRSDMAMVAQAADKVVLAARIRLSGALVDEALDALDAGRDRFGGIWIAPAAQQAAA